jgi:rhodanese-related sulfurtransferase
VATVQHGTAPDTTAAVAEGAVSLAEMKRIFDTGTAYIIDARDPYEYDEGHIPGAINVPYDRLPEYLDMLSGEVPMDGEVIVYCRGPDCDFSDTLATELKILGYQNVRVFTGGWEQWNGAGYPVEGMVPK